MKHPFTTSVVFVALAVFSSATGITLQEGDCWSYDTRPGEESSYLVIRKVETLPRIGEVAHIAIFGLHMKNPLSRKPLITIPYVAITGAALRGSIKQRLNVPVPQNEWLMGYTSWHQGFDAGLNSPIQTPVREYIDESERVFARAVTTPVESFGEVGVVRTVERMELWQVRRARFASVAQAVRESKPAAQNEFDALLWEAKSRPFTRTPLEKLDLLGFHYLPKDGIEKTLPDIVATMAVGWYDVLRFCSQAGREAMNRKESFFDAAFLAAGEPAGLELKKFIRQNTARAHELIEQGLRSAAIQRHDQRYYHQWPSAYQDGVKSELPRQEWAAAWEEAKAAVVKSLEG